MWLFTKVVIWLVCCISLCELRIPKGDYKCHSEEGNCFTLFGRCREYYGNKSTTLSGKTCQAWGAQTPNTHNTESSTDLNYCRRNDNLARPWCYTTDPKVKWEYCFDDCERFCYSHHGACYADRRVCTNNQIKSVTKSGYPCQWWNSQTPHSRALEYSRAPWSYPKNHCSGSSMPFCFTTLPNIESEECYNRCECGNPDKNHYSKDTMKWTLHHKTFKFYPNYGSRMTGECVGNRTFVKNYPSKKMTFTCGYGNMWKPPLDYCSKPELAKCGVYEETRYDDEKDHVISGSKCFFQITDGQPAEGGGKACAEYGAKLAELSTYQDYVAVRDKFIMIGTNPTYWRYSMYRINGFLKNQQSSTCGIDCYVSKSWTDEAREGLNMIDSLNSWSALGCYNSADDCYYQYPGCSEYVGSKSTTLGGFTCQAWNTQKPHRHGYDPMDNNHFCRRYTSKLPWCYTTNPGKRWDYCFKQCPTPPGCYNAVSDCYYQFSGCTEYAGTKSTTLKGYTCQAWSSQSPHTHSYASGNNLNYCRRYNSTRPWCYTTSSSQVFDYCFEDCPKPASCVDSDRNCYKPNSCRHSNGNKSTTLTNLTCQSWAAQTPHTHKVDPAKNKANYCDLNGSKIPWCYTTSSTKRSEYCFTACPAMPRDDGSLEMKAENPQNCLAIRGHKSGKLAIVNYFNCHNDYRSICEIDRNRRTE